MTQTPVFSTRSSLPDLFSSTLTALFETAKPAIVQVQADQRGGGTGVVWSTDGHIITNNHVTPHDRAKIQVHFSDGRSFDAQILSHNPELDLALLKIDTSNLNALSAGDSARLRTGEWVFAIGHPWGQRWTMTSGIVSTIGSTRIAPNTTMQYIKTDVRLAPGNSGGPLLDADGNVVGINAMIFGGDLSISIPSNAVTSWLASLPRHRNTLGVEIQSIVLPTHIHSTLKREQKHGLIIVSTLGRQSAHHDLLPGDILLTVTDTPVEDGTTLRQTLTKSKESNTIAVTILRDGTVITLDVALLTTKISL